MLISLQHANAMAPFPAKEREAFMAHWQGMMKDPNVFKKTIAADGEVLGNVDEIAGSG
jgi:hypothetical protein